MNGTSIELEWKVGLQIRIGESKWQLLNQAALCLAYDFPTWCTLLQ